MILYFTGTGNSRYAADYLSKLTDDELVCINDYLKENKKGETFTSNRPFVFVTPVYAWRIPRIVSMFIASNKFAGNQKAYFAVTCGDSIGNSEKYIRRLCDIKGFHHMGTAQIRMPENYLAMFNVPDESTCNKIIKNASYPIRKLADSINSEGTLAPVKASFAGKIESGIVNGLFYKFQVKASGFHVTDKCTRCRKCEEVCPLNNISFLDNRPVWGNECTHCMACICRCPAEAIEYKKASLGRRRYTNNKEVTL